MASLVISISKGRSTNQTELASKGFLELIAAMPWHPGTWNFRVHGLSTPSPAIESKLSQSLMTTDGVQFRLEAA